MAARHRYSLPQGTNVIVGALNFNENLHDSKTLEPVLEQYEKLNSKLPKEVYADRGYRGPKQVKAVAIKTPRPDANISTTQRNKHKRRAAIEPIIGHLKNDYRLCRNYLKGSMGDQINLLLSAAAWNFKRVINLWRTEETNWWQLIFLLFKNVYPIPYVSTKMKLTF